MVWIAAIGLGLIVGFATHGSLDNLARLHFRWPWLVVAVLGVRAAAVLTPLRGVEGVQYMYAAGLQALIARAIWDGDPSAVHVCGGTRGADRLGHLAREPSRRHMARRIRKRSQPGRHPCEWRANAGGARARRFAGAARPRRPVRRDVVRNPPQLACRLDLAARTCRMGTSRGVQPGRPDPRPRDRSRRGPGDAI